MANPVLYLFVGYPGAGKTTIAKIIEQATGAVHLWADHERRRLFGEPTHSSAENAKLYAYLDDLTDKLLGEGTSVIFDTNFNFRKDRDFLRSIAQKNGATTRLIWVTTARELAEERAVKQSHGQDTRLYGNMSAEDFERIAGHLEPPAAEEQPIKVDGIGVTAEQIKRLLDL